MNFSDKLLSMEDNTEKIGQQSPIVVFTSSWMVKTAKVTIAATLLYGLTSILAYNRFYSPEFVSPLIHFFRLFPAYEGVKWQANCGVGAMSCQVTSTLMAVVSGMNFSAFEWFKMYFVLGIYLLPVELVWNFHRLSKTPSGYLRGYLNSVLTKTEKMF